ncbi:protein LLP homolog [Zootermopsis nevadensis]|uniref:LLP-like protein n=1 Tax=Zootermopsis nevadensis TaxID=136037 RepID=A0A067RA65_ZOONE|nr:protein LLP homolog [Zootermopsis nevadensis]XP_021917545.1 protein LLP homolog [Zootermopsis nevadensis]KDR20656.1 LLP-like protein [Zootermopsis nevadensis]
MAKSLRSKWKRKMRAIKRERYGKKELALLKKVLGIDENGDTEMKDIDNIATVIDAKSIQEKRKDVPEEKSIEEAGKVLMEIDQVKPKYNKKTLRDECGNYPEWLSRREVKKRAIVNRKRKDKLKRKHIKDKQKKKN